MFEHGALPEDIRKQLGEDVEAIIVLSKRDRTRVLVAEHLVDRVNVVEPDIQYLVDVELMKKAVARDGQRWCNADGIWWPCPT